MLHRTNYYEEIEDKCKIVYEDERDYCIFEEANENPEDWIVIVDPDVDVVTVFDKVNKIAYHDSYKGYELIEAGVVRNLKVQYEYIEEFIEDNL